MRRVVYTGRLFPELYDVFLKEVKALKKKDPLVPVAVLVGSNIAAQFLKRRFAEDLDGFANIDFFTIIDLAKFFCRYGSNDYTQTIPPLADYVVARDILESGNVPEPFCDVRQTEGLIASFLCSFADIGESGIDFPDAVELLRKKGSDFEPRVRGVFEIYGRFRERIRAIGLDSISLFSEAASMAGAAETGYTFFSFGLYDFNELQWKLLDEASKNHPFTFFIPYGHGEEYMFAQSAVDRFKKMGFDVVEGSKGGEPITASTVKIVNAPGEEEESRVIVERIISLIREKGYAFDDIAVLLPSTDPYQGLLREAFEDAGIPYFETGEPLSVRSRVAKGVLSLMPLLQGGFKRSDLVDFLSVSPLKQDGTVPRNIDAVALWVKVSAEDGVSVVGDEWAKESEALVDRLLRRNQGSDDPVLDAARFVHAVISKVLNRRKDFLTPSSWSEFADRLLSLVAELFEDEEDASYEYLRGVSALDRVASPVLFNTFVSVVRKVLSAPSPVKTRFGEGVSLIPLGSARGLRFKAVFIPGLAERIFPSMVRQDPLLLDDDRRGITEFFREKALLREKMERLDEEKLIFTLALGAAGDFLQLSYPRYEDGTGRPRMRSSFFRFVFQNEGEGSRSLRLNEERIGRFIGGSADESRGPISLQELFLSGAKRFLKGKGILPTGLFFKASSRMVRERWGKMRFTRYDGVLGTKRALKELGKFMEEQDWSFSPTSFEQYARCPFAYFLSRILGVETVDEVDAISVSPSLRGIITHRILARLYQRFSREGLLPLSGANRESVMAVADEVISSELKQAEESEPVGLDVFWEIERESIRRAVNIFVNSEIDEDSSFVPAYFEKPFGGRGREDVSFDLPKRHIHFKGRIDRIDVSSDKLAFRVIDYKTGKLSGKDNGLEGGRHIQLPIYLIAASSLLDIPLERGVAEYCSVNTSSAGKVVRFEGSDWSEASSELVEILKTFIDGITKGFFFALADNKLCQGCSLRSACPSGHRNLLYRKTEVDDRADQYLAVKSSEEE